MATLETLSPDELGFDPDALRIKYQQERDKRLREDGEQQFMEVTTGGAFGGFVVDDPYAGPPPPREPVTDEIEVVIIGGGWVGLITAARLIQAGIENVRIVDGGADFGGTWYWNRYPGAQCDVESYIYLPLLEETSYVPKERYSYAPEIYEHAQRIAKHFGLYPKAMFQTWVTDLDWDEDEQRWIVITNRGDRMRAHFVAVGPGPCNRLRLPNIPGIDDFAGHSFHTSRWDYNYTGGSHDQPLEKLVDKRVAIIGTGATAIQCVGPVGASAEHLYVFQRTPSSVDFRNNTPTDPEWAKTLEPGWQRQRQRHFNDLLGFGAALLDGQEVNLEQGLYSDSWARQLRNIKQLLDRVGDPSQLSPEEKAELAELADFATMEQIRGRVDETIKDREVAAKLKAWYKQFCKRPTFSDDYLSAFNRPNVTLVDVSDSKGVERITKTGVVANGVEHEVDCIIYATGFEVTSDYHRRLGIDIHGRGGQSIYDHWAEGMRTFHSHSVHGFPNLFIVGGLFGFLLGPNYCSTVDDQAGHVAYIISEVTKRGAWQVQATPEAEEAWIDEMRTAPKSARIRVDQSCTPGYYNREGQRVKNRSIRREMFTRGPNAFSDLLQAWRDEGKLEGLELR